MNRLQLHRTRGWRKPEGAVIVSRPGFWGNPWSAGEAWPEGRERPARIHVPTLGRGWHGSGLLRDMLSVKDAVRLHREWLRTGRAILPPRLTDEKRQWLVDCLAHRRIDVLDSLPSLAGRDLLCFCPPGAPCHGDTLLALANA